MPTEEELEESDYRSTFKNFHEDFVDLENVRNDSPDPDNDADQNGTDGPEVASSGAAASVKMPVVITDKDLQQLFQLHMKLGAFIRRSRTSSPRSTWTGWQRFFLRPV
jgi:hypothetical protein